MFIQTEATPNPATLKFLPGKPVLPGGTRDYRDAEAAATGWDSKADDETTTPEEAVKFRTIAQVIRLCQNWEGADAARREMAVKELEGIFYGGLDKLRRTISARMERVGMLRDSARNGTGMTGKAEPSAIGQKSASGRRSARLTTTE